MLGVIEDATKKITIEKLLSDPAVRWSTSQSDVLNFFVFQISLLAEAVSLINEETGTKTLYVIRGHAPLHDYFDFYIVENGTIENHVKTGDRLAYGTRPIKHRSFAFPVDFEPNQALDIILRIDTHDGLYDALPLYLMPRDDFFYSTEQENLLYGFYFGR